MSQPNNGSLIPTIRWPVPKNNRGGVFSNLDDILTHIQGESTGHYLFGSNAMWHGGIHITDETTPWCALSGKSPQEAIDYPAPYKGEQQVRCMVDGEVVAYRVNRDYQTLEWESGELAYSASFVLLRHKVQPGQTAASTLTFYTAYIHLAPWSAYPDESDVYKVADGQHLRAYIDNSLQWVAATLPPGTRVSWNIADPAAHMTANGRQYAHVSLVEGIDDKMTLKAGDMLWTVCDKGNLLPDSGPVRPAWWANLLPPAKAVMQFDKVVCPTPYPIKAGDAVGHMGYFQLPKDGGYNKRHQVHIECISTDMNLPAFLQNPEHVGKDNPVYMKFPDGTPLCTKNLTTKTITPDGRSTRGEAILTLNQVRTEQDAHKAEYWFLPYANGYVPKSDTSVEMLSQYDLEKRGFSTAVDETPVSFDHLDGKTPPKGLVRKIYDALVQASSKDTRITHRAVPHNYQRLLYRIDGNISPYSSQEYLSAIHNPSYRDVKDRMIVKHPSEWYFSPNDPIWQTFLQSIKQDAPEWYDYSVSYLEGVRWMNQVPEMTETLWHMHPLVFLAALKPAGYDFSTRESTIRAIVKESKKQGFTLNTQIAYILATVKRETGDTFKPVREGDWIGHTSTDEYRRTHYRYYPYYGRGFVQITWDYNYRAYSEKLGIDLVADPDKALDPDNALFILIDGIKSGVFTGKKLTDYVSSTNTDFFHARRCINGLDHAEQIKSFAVDFLSKLDAGEWQ